MPFFLSDRLFVALVKRTGSPDKEVLRACRDAQLACVAGGRPVTLFSVARARGLIDPERFLSWARQVVAQRPTYAEHLFEVVAPPPPPLAPIPAPPPAPPLAPLPAREEDLVDAAEDEEELLEASDFLAEESEGAEDDQEIETAPSDPFGCSEEQANPFARDPSEELEDLFSRLERLQPVSTQHEVEPLPPGEEPSAVIDVQAQWVRGWESLAENDISQLETAEVPGSDELLARASKAARELVDERDAVADSRASDEQLMSLVAEAEAIEALEASAQQALGEQLSTDAGDVVATLGAFADSGAAPAPVAPDPAAHAETQSGVRWGDAGRGDPLDDALEQALASEEFELADLAPQPTKQRPVRAPKRRRRFGRASASEESREKAEKPKKGKQSGSKGSSRERKLARRAPRPGRSLRAPALSSGSHELESGARPRRGRRSEAPRSRRRFGRGRPRRHAGSREDLPARV